MIVPAGAYPGQTEPVHSVGSWCYILAPADARGRRRLPSGDGRCTAGHAGLVTRLRAGARDDAGEHLGRGAEPEQIHPGVLRYLREIGVMR